MITFNFDINKLSQIVNYLLKLNRFRLNYTKLIKLLYLADREALKLWDTTITKDHYYNMKSGPVLSCLYDLIQGRLKNENQSFWDRFFITDVFDLKSIIKNDLPEDELSPREQELLQKIDKKFKKYDYKAMIKYCHDNLEEYEKPIPIESRVPLKINKILKILGRSEEEIKEFELENKIYLEEEKILLNNA